MIELQYGMTMTFFCVGRIWNNKYLLTIGGILIKFVYKYLGT